MEFLQGLKVQAYIELREATNWEEHLRLKGSLDLLDLVFSFTESVEDIIRQKTEEEQERAINGNGNNGN